MLGLVSTKTSQIEDRDALMRRVGDAGRYLASDQMAVSPQCGFASVESGNPMSAQAQEAKLRLVVELAETIWGSA